ncbi:MAG: LysM peptidoglycan-binding domain-containing protein [Planctomycetota bacterium]
MNTTTLSTLCAASLLMASVGCNQVNRIYEQDTGDIAAVPGPPAADAGYTPPPAEVEFVEPMDAGDEDAMLAAEVDAIEPLPEPEPAPLQTYTIQKGDSFWKIAKTVYGDPLRMKDIEAANPDVDPKKLTIGDEIVLPE